jgi:hypothetical protein
VLGVAPVAHADEIPYLHIGTPNPITYDFIAAATGNVIAYFAGSGAGYDEQLGMLDDGILTASGFGLDDHTSSIGQSFNLGHVTAGDILTFLVDVVSPPIGYVYSNPDLNRNYDINDSEGHNHVYATPYTATSPIIASDIPAGTYVGFEDLAFPFADFNYFDEAYVFTDVADAAEEAQVTEPAPLAVLGVGLIGMWSIRRRNWSWSY